MKLIETVEVKDAPVLHFRLEQVNNNTFVATLEEGFSRNNSGEVYDDPRGAMFYVVAVVCIYGLSILLMIASVIKKSKSDHGLSKYMSDIDKVRRIEKRQEKFKTRLAMQRRQQRSPSCAETSGAATPGTSQDSSLEKKICVESGGSVVSSTSQGLPEEKQLLLPSITINAEPPSPEVPPRQLASSTNLALTVEMELSSNIQQSAALLLGATGGTDSKHVETSSMTAYTPPSTSLDTVYEEKEEDNV